MKLYVDENCELLRWARSPVSQPWPFLLSYIHDTFYELSQIQIEAGSVLIVGANQLKNNATQIRQIIESQHAAVVFANPLEGGDTLERWINYCRLGDLADHGKLKVISGGQQKAHWNYWYVDNFVLMVLDQPENTALLTTSAQQVTQARPFSFLYLSGRARQHRVTMLGRLQQQGLLEGALWSNLDPKAGEVKFLPSQYESPLFAQDFDPSHMDYFDIKHKLFDTRWGEVYINAASYNDTYFSVVSETCFDTDKTFRTEKIWKPILMKHPFVVVSNPGYLAQLRNLGFRTFESIWCEAYDLEQDHDLRLDQLVKLIQHLCESDLPSIAQQCRDICEHNQQHLLRYQQQLLQQIPNDIMKFLCHA